LPGHARPARDLLVNSDPQLGGGRVVLLEPRPERGRLREEAGLRDGTRWHRSVSFRNERTGGTPPPHSAPRGQTRQAGCRAEASARRSAGGRYVGRRFARGGLDVAVAAEEVGGVVPGLDPAEPVVIAPVGGPCALHTVFGQVEVDVAAAGRERQNVLPRLADPRDVRLALHLGCPRARDSDDVPRVAVADRAIIGRALVRGT